MQKGYLFYNHKTGAACEFNANSEQQARQRMTKQAKKWWRDNPSDWELYRVSKKVKFL